MLVTAIAFVPGIHRHEFHKAQWPETNLIPPPPELRDYILREELGVASCHIDVDVLLSHQAIEDILEVLHELNFIAKEVILLPIGNLPFGECVEHLWIEILLIVDIIESHFDDTLRSDSRIQQMVLEDPQQQIGFACSPEPSDNFNKPVIFPGNQFVQISVSLYFHDHPHAVDFCYYCNFLLHQSLLIWESSLETSCMPRYTIRTQHFPMGVSLTGLQSNHTGTCSAEYGGKCVYMQCSVKEECMESKRKQHVDTLISKRYNRLKNP